MDEILETENNELGVIKISEEVVSIIAGLAATEVEGVSTMSGGFVGGITDILGMKNLSKGVKVTVTEKEAKVDLFIVVHYGVRIPDVAWHIQENVKKSIETMTGLNVTEVNINIQGIDMGKDKDKEKDKEKETKEEETQKNQQA